MWVIVSRKVRWVGHTVCVGVFLKETRWKEITSKKQVEVGRILLKGILKK
jgi:hypothetical protein